jgi:hypothetical protein
MISGIYFLTAGFGAFINFRSKVLKKDYVAT